VTGRQPDEAKLARLYDGLARYQAWRRRLSGAAAGTGLEMHKRLLSPEGDGPEAGSAGLNAWLWARVDMPGARRVLDVGCGFGATLLDWARRAPEAELVGWTLSPYQARVAAREARRAGVAERCAFRVRSFDAPADARDADPFEVVVSVESLFHAPDAGATLGRLSERLAPGGTLVLVEDLARDDGVAEEPDARELLARWRTTRLHTADELRVALDEAGLELVEDRDLTAQVPHRADVERAASRRRLSRLRAVLPFAAPRAILDAFLGGVALEALYARGRMSYRMLRVLRREDVV
jgi:SAM-dependent methyltransferase